METNGNLIVRRIDEILVKTKDTRANLCRVLDMKQSTLSTWIARGTIPSVTDCMKIAEYLHCSVEWLVYGTENKMSNEELQLLEKWRNLSADDKEEIMTLINLKNKKIYDKEGKVE